MELEVAPDTGGIIRGLKFPIPLDKAFQPQHICHSAAAGRLSGCLLLEHDPQVIDLDDFLRVYLGDL
jgi:hypothetical protein